MTATFGFVKTDEKQAASAFDEEVIDELASSDWLVAADLSVQSGCDQWPRHSFETGSEIATAGLAAFLGICCPTNKQPSGRS